MYNVSLTSIIGTWYFRWDISCIDRLPEYMQICYRALFDVFEAIENELAKKERSYRVSYAKDAVSVKQFNFSCFFFFLVYFSFYVIISLMLFKP